MLYKSFTTSLKMYSRNVKYQKKNNILVCNSIPIGLLDMNNFKEERYINQIVVHLVN